MGNRLQLYAHENDQLKDLAARHHQALDAINQVRRLVDASREQQIEERK